MTIAEIEKVKGFPGMVKVTIIEQHKSYPKSPDTIIETRTCTEWTADYFIWHRIGKSSPVYRI